MNLEIAALMQRFPFKYPSANYKSEKRKFNIILNELYESGVIANVKPQRIRKFKALNGVRYIYQYHAIINFEVVKVCVNYETARIRIFREYLKVRKNEKASSS